jgi:hypothetical protein
VKPDVTDVNPRSYRHTERLNPAIEVLIIESVLIVPDPCRRIGYFVPHEPDTIISRGGLDLIHCRPCTYPDLYGRLHPHGATGC